MATFEEKTWKDRVSTYPTRRVLTDTDGGTQTVTIERAEGTVTTEGDAFNAANMNDLEGRIAAAVETLETNFQAGCDTIADALTAAGVDTAEGATPEEIAEGIATLAAGGSSGGATIVVNDDDLDDGIDDPTDGLTHLHMLIGPNGTGYFGCHVTSDDDTAYVTVDWGDGSTDQYETGSKYPSHTYSNTASAMYDIVITASDGVDYFRPFSFKGLSTGKLIKAFFGDKASAAYGYCFDSCYNLIYVDFGDITEIGEYTCNKCYNLSKVKLPDTLTTIGQYAFAYCANLKSLSLPAALESVGGYAFEFCYNLTSVSISTTSLTDVSFYMCPHLAEISGLSLAYSETSTSAVSLTYGFVLTTLTDVGVIERSINIYNSPLFYDSIINLFNALSSEYTGTISLSTGCYAILSEDDIAIATDKGWTVKAQSGT